MTRILEPVSLRQKAGARPLEMGIEISQKHDETDIVARPLTIMEIAAIRYSVLFMPLKFYRHINFT